MGSALYSLVGQAVSPAWPQTVHPGSKDFFALSSATCRP
jgi:hypothetical protein